MADPDALRVLAAYNTQLDVLRRRVLALVSRSWGTLGAFYEPDIDRWVSTVVPIIAGGQQTTAALTAAYLSAYESIVLGEPLRPFGIDPDTITTEALRGVPAGEVYQRAGVTVRAAIAQGVDLTAAAARGRDRALSMASTDLQLAKTHTANRYMRDNDNVGGYRRVLKGSKSCGLCLVASTQRYHKAELMPIHPGCDCGVQPIIGDRDPGQVIDPERLQGIHDRIAERFGASDAGARDPFRSANPSDRFADYRKALVAHDHGEIGPVLAVRGQDFTGPRDI